MKKILFASLLFSIICSSQNKSDQQQNKLSSETYIKAIDNLTLNSALLILNKVNNNAAQLDKKVAIAILDASGTIIIIARGDGVGPHNTEAARRKAFTALSTKTQTLALLRNAESNQDTKNLATLPELLLLSGGSPIYYKGNIVGSIGVAGGGSPENDNVLALSATIQEIGITTNK